MQRLFSMVRQLSPHYVWGSNSAIQFISLISKLSDAVIQNSVILQVIHPDKNHIQAIKNLHHLYYQKVFHESDKTVIMIELNFSQQVWLLNSTQPYDDTFW